MRDDERAARSVAAEVDVDRDGIITEVLSEAKVDAVKRRPQRDGSWRGQ